MKNKILTISVIVLCAVLGGYIGLTQVSAQKDFDIPNIFAREEKNDVEKDKSESGDIEAESGEKNSLTTPTPTPTAIKQTSSSPKELRAVYITGWSIGTKSVRENLIKSLKDNEFNAVIVDIKDEGGQLTYDSTVQTAIDIGASKHMVNNMSKILDELHKNNIYVIGRIVTFKDPILAGNPDTVVAYKLENGKVWRDYQDNFWPNPYNKNSWEYPIELAIEAAELGFDEIQFDYVRFPLTEGKTSTIVYGFDSNKKSKADIICEFLEEAVSKLSKYKVAVSTTINGNYLIKKGDVDNIGQDFERMTKIVDYIYPILYPSEFSEYTYKIANPDKEPYEIVFNTLKDGLARLDNTSKIRPLLQDFTATWLGEGKYITYGTDEVTEQLKALYDNNIKSFALWSSANKYHYGALKIVK